MPIIVYGISHKTAPLHIREHFSFSLEDIPQALIHLRQACPKVKEAMILSTCQRTEWYLYAEEEMSLELSHLLFRKTYIAEIQAHSYTLYETDAIKHMMKVANGLDSSLLGESQILGQTKLAYTLAKNLGFLGKHLEQVLQSCFSSAKKIKHQTLIGHGTVSLPYTAVSLGKCIFADISNPYVVLIGGGTVIQDILNHLVKKKNLTVVIASRSIEKGRKLAEKYHAKAVSMDELSPHIALADIVISATSSPDQILSYEQVKAALSIRTRRLIFMMDMAVPRDIAPEVAHLKNVFLYNIDDLHKIVQKHLDARAQAAIEAEQLIEEQIEALLQKMQINENAACIDDFRKSLNLYRQKLTTQAIPQLSQQCPKEVITRVIQKLEVQILASLRSTDSCPSFQSEALSKAFHLLDLGKAPERVLSEVTRSFVNKRLHKPTLYLRKRLQEGLTQKMGV